MMRAYVTLGGNDHTLVTLSDDGKVVFTGSFPQQWIDYVDSRDEEAIVIGGFGENLPLFPVSPLTFHEYLRRIVAAINRAMNTQYSWRLLDPIVVPGKPPDPDEQRY